MRRQEIVREEMRCFGCREKEHKKWECSKMKEKKREKVAPLQKVWKKVKEHSRARGLPLRGAAIYIKR